VLNLIHTDGFLQLFIVVFLLTASTDTAAHPYADPQVNASTMFQQRVMQMTSLEAETKRWERSMAIAAAAAAARLKRKPPTTTAAVTGGPTAAKDS